MKYIEDAIDIKSEYGRKYMALISRPDAGNDTEVHHIVPVAYYENVLGVVYTRRTDSKDMNKDNLVSLSKGHHLLAHYYIYKCSKPCIRAAMAGALSMMLRGKDVKSRLSELTEDQAIELANAVDEAKKFSGWKIRRVPGGFTGKYLYVEGKITHGFLLKPNGTVRRYVDHINEFALDEDWDHEVSIWGTHNSDVVASTNGYGFANDKVVYQSNTIPRLRVNMDFCDVHSARLALTFKPLICALYPRFKKRFDSGWEKDLNRVKEKFPDATPYDFINPPKK